MEKKKLPGIICALGFVLVSASLMFYAAYLRMDYLSRVTLSADMRIDSHGAIYELRDDGGEIALLRWISPDGELSSYFSFLKTDFTRGEAIERRLLDARNGEAWLLETRRDVFDYSVTRESIIRCVFDSGKTELLFSRDNGNGHIEALVYSNNIFGDLTYAISREDSGVKAWRLSLDGGNGMRSLSIDVPEGVTRIFTVPGGELAALTPHGAVYVINPETGDARLLRGPSAETGAVICADICENGYLYLYAADGERGTLLKIDISTGEEVPAEQPVEGLVYITVSADGLWAGVDKGNCIVRSGSGPIEKVKVSPLLLSDTFSMILAAVVICVIGVVFLFLANILRKKKLSIMAKQIAFTLPLFITGLIVIFIGLMSQIRYEKKEAVIHELLWRTQAKADELKLLGISGIKWPLSYDDEALRAVRESLSASLGGGNIRFYDGSDGMWYTDADYINYYFYLVRDGRAYTACCGDLPMALPYDFAHRQDSRAILEALLENKAPVFGKTFAPASGIYIFTVMFPITDDTGGLLGFIETSVPYARETYFYMRTELVLLVRVCVLMAAIAFVYHFVLELAFRRLKRLKLAAEELQKGNYGYRIKESGWDELRDISAAFNDMARQVEISMSHISETSESYSRFVPRELFSILGKETVLDVELGDNSDIECSLLRIYTGAFKVSRDSSLFDALNRYFKAIMPVIAQAGGIVEHYSETVLSALFRGSPPTVIGAAVMIFRSLDKTGSFNDSGVQCTAVIGRSELRVGIIGHGERLCASVVSVSLAESRRLGNLGERLGCRILLMGEAVLPAPGKPFARECRLLGYTRINDADSAFYEVFAADPEALRAPKRETLEMFNKALKLYYKSKYYESRALFIEIIKKSPEDLAAREYLLLSDTLMQSGGDPVLPV